MKKLKEILIKILFPQRCAYCGKVIPADSLMCPKCEKALPRIEKEICVRCGREKAFCSCRGERYHTCTVAPFYYEGIVQTGVRLFKFRNFPQNYEAYAYEVAEAIRKRLPDKKFDLIVSVPITEKSVRKRGYDQAYLIAEKLGEHLSVECRKDVLVKIYETKTQHSLNSMFRRGNLLGVFDVVDRKAVEDKTILLCDDISTSGETFNECAKMLWLNGAKEVCCAAVALTKSQKKK